MAGITDYTSPIDKLQPSDLGFTAVETAARRIGTAYGQNATIATRIGKLNAEQIGGLKMLLPVQGSGGGARISRGRSPLDSFLNMDLSGNVGDGGHAAAYGTAIAANLVNKGPKFVSPLTDPTPDNAYIKSAPSDRYLAPGDVGSPQYGPPSWMAPGALSPDIVPNAKGTAGTIVSNYPGGAPIQNEVQPQNYPQYDPNAPTSYGFGQTVSDAASSIGSAAGAIGSFLGSLSDAVGAAYPALNGAGAGEGGF